MRNCIFGLSTLLAGTALFSGCSSTAAEDASGTSSDELSAAEIMTRANQYIAANIVYCGGPKGQQDETGCGEGICEPPTGPWDAYRQDCSGFVSYLWQIASDPDTATYHYDQSGSQGWTTISIDSLRAGDAIVANVNGEGHIKLFSRLVNDHEMEIYEEYDCNRVARKAVQAFEHVGNQVLIAGDSRPYHAIRRNALTPPPPPPPPPHPGPPTVVPPGVTGCGVIPAGHGLVRGKAVRSCDGRFELVMQGDGNLVEYGPSGAMWNTHTSGTDGFVAEVRGDGDFVLYGKTRDAKWSTGTTRSNGAVLDIQSDGNLVVREGTRALWNSGTEFPSAPVEPTACGVINPGHGLAAGKSLRSCDGRFTLAMQTDGNLVLYKGGHALWSSETNGQHGYKAVMQGDGNFALYDWKGATIWSTHSNGHAGAKLDLQNDGNVVVYAGTRAEWSSGTSGR